MVKHIALRSLSLWRAGHPYTTPGVGDRIHSILFAIQYAKKHNCQVELHLTSDKYGKQIKKDSWKELCEISDGLVTVTAHNVCQLSEPAWIDYLSQRGIEAQTYYYSDALDTLPLGPVAELDLIKADDYLKESPELSPIVTNIKGLPEKYVTVQWDTTDEARKIDPMKVLQIESRYNLPVVTVGGAATRKELKTSLITAGAVISRAERHVGIDSGFFHLAQLYLPYDKIDIYNTGGWIKGKLSHHVSRAIQNGSKLNRYL